MHEELCELRFDIPLSEGGGPRQFEHGWRDVLAAQRLTALAMPPAQAVSARYRLCGSTDEHLSAYLPSRLAALPGSPAVAAEPPTPSPDWRGVKIWLGYRAPDLAALLRRAKAPQKSARTRGQRP